ncbi:Com family DNA-binding transcriptional regulator [Candidatus Giovannonibacteria bacterium]|nr:Com family DNA-binding transcriptional regulator [Candidatus Giovannonibacteria bacterium]
MVINMILREFRCKSCQKLLFKGILVDSKVEVKCTRCREFSEFEGVSANTLLCLKENCPNRVVLAEKVA